MAGAVTGAPAPGADAGNADAAGADAAVVAGRLARAALLGTLAAAGAAILFGTAFIAIVVQLRSFEPLPGALWRAVLGGVALFGAVLVFSQQGFGGSAGQGTVGTSARPATRRDTRGNVARILLLGVLSGPIFLVTQNLAVNDLGATVSGFVVGLYAVFAAVLGPIVARDRLEWPAIFGFVAALVGTALLSELRLERLSTVGMAAGIFGAVGYSFYLVLGRRWTAPLGLRPEIIALASAGLTVVAVLAWLGVTAPETIFPADVRAEALLALAWLAFVLVAGQTMVMASVRRIPAQRSAAFLLLNPLTSAFLALLVLGEQVSPPQVVGALLVLLGIAMATRAWLVLAPLRASRASRAAGG